MPTKRLLVLAIGLLALLPGCTMSKIMNEAKACIAPLETEPRYALANTILFPEGGVTPSMLANHSLPTPEHLAQFGPYLDLKTRCQRKAIDDAGSTSISGSLKYKVMVSQGYLHWQNYADFLSGTMTYSDFFGNQERIRSATDSEMAQIAYEQDQAKASADAQERQAKAKAEQACLAGGGVWRSGYCRRPIDSIWGGSRTIKCTTYGNETTCRD